MITYIVGILFVVAKVTEFLFLISVSFDENLARRVLREEKFLKKVSLERSLLSLEFVEVRTAYTFVFLPLSNFFICDFPTSLILKSSMLIVLALLLELFMPMISYYVGEILSKNIEEQHVKYVLYKEIEIRGRIPIWYVRKIVPEIVLNEKLINKTVKLIDKEKSSIAYVHMLSTLCIICVVCSTYGL